MPKSLIAEPDSLYLRELSAKLKETSLKMCFVCAGNICRSPMAEAVARHLTVKVPSNKLVLSSAGTGAWHIGHNADSRALRVLAKSEIEFHGHSAKQYSDTWTADLDLVVALDRSNYRDLAGLTGLARSPAKLVLLRSFETPPSAVQSALRDLDVPDPYFGSEADFERSLTIIWDGVHGLLRELIGRY